VRLLLYVDPADAQPVAVRPARLRPAADPPAADELGVTIYPGLPVVVTKQSGARALVQVQDDALRATGWVEASDVGALFEPTAAPSRSGPQVALQPATPLLDGPGGAVLAQTTPQALLSCQVLAPDRGGFTKILVRSIETAANGTGTLNYEVRAFVPTRALGPPGTAGTASAGLRPVTGYSETFTLPRGTLLYDHPGGSLIGLTIGKASAWRGGAPEGAWQRIWVPTPWGAVALWMTRPPSPGGDH
jgi:hypothetical protein